MPVIQTVTVTRPATTIRFVEQAQQNQLVDVFNNYLESGQILSYSVTHSADRLQRTYTTTFATEADRQAFQAERQSKGLNKKVQDYQTDNNLTTIFSVQTV